MSRAAKLAVLAYTTEFPSGGQEPHYVQYDPITDTSKVLQIWLGFERGSAPAGSAPLETKDYTIPVDSGVFIVVRYYIPSGTPQFIYRVFYAGGVESGELTPDPIEFGDFAYDEAGTDTTLMAAYDTLYLYAVDGDGANIRSFKADGSVDQGIIDNAGLVPADNITARLIGSDGGGSLNTAQYWLPF